MARVAVPLIAGLGVVAALAAAAAWRGSDGNLTSDSAAAMATYRIAAVDVYRTLLDKIGVTMTPAQAVADYDRLLREAVPPELWDTLTPTDQKDMKERVQACKDNLARMSPSVPVYTR